MFLIELLVHHVVGAKFVATAHPLQRPLTSYFHHEPVEVTVDSGDRRLTVHRRDELHSGNICLLPYMPHS